MYYRFRDLKKEILNTVIDESNVDKYRQKINDLVNLEYIKHYMQINHFDLQETKFNIAKAMHYRLVNDEYLRAYRYDYENMRQKNRIHLRRLS